MKTARQVRTHPTGQTIPTERKDHVHPNSHDDGQHLVTLADGNAVTTSLVIAEGTDVQHKNLRELIQDNLADFEEFGGVRFETAKPSEGSIGGRPVKYAVLNEQHATLLMTYMRNSEVVRAFKKRLVKAFYALANARPAVDPATITRRDLALMVVDAEDRADRAEEKARELAPKAEYVDTYVADEDHFKFSTVASTLGMKETELRDLLIAKNWIYCETTSRWSETKGRKVTINRYSEYAHKKPYFYRSLTHDAPRFRGEVMHTLKITAPGAQAVARLVRRGEDGPVLEVVS